MWNIVLWNLASSDKTCVGGCWSKTKIKQNLLPHPQYCFKKSMWPDWGNCTVSRKMVLTATVHGTEKLPSVRLRVALVYGYKNRCLEGSFPSCQFNWTTVVCYPVGSVTVSVMCFITRFNSMRHEFPPMQRVMVGNAEIPVCSKC